MSTQPKWTTVVGPGEYDIEADMERLVEIHNRDRDGHVPCDVGKVIGLYRAWKALKESVEGLMRQSDGVAGLHKNGDMADWQWLVDNDWLEGVER